jgi:glycosyltransferase involved in cell wall biosynthesis
MLTHSNYEEDARVRREAETLVRAGVPVDVFGLTPPGGIPGPRDVDGVHLERLPVERHQGAGLGTYTTEYLDFFARAMVAATRAHVRRRYMLVEVHTLPDFLVLAGVPLRLAGGVPLLLNLHEAMPEFFKSRFATVPPAAARLAERALLFQERASIAVADAVVTVNDSLRDRLVALGVAPEKITVVMNAPDLRRFDPAGVPDRPFMADGTLRLVYAGAVTPTYELDVVLDAVAEIRRHRPDLPLHAAIYGRGDAQPALEAQVAALGLGRSVTFGGRIPLEGVPAAIAAADIGLAPTRRSDMTDVSLSTKLFEYAAMGKQVVASGLPTVRRYFAPDTVAFYNPGDAQDLAAAILRLADSPAERASRLEATASRVAALGWDVQAAKYAGVVERLTGRTISAGDGGVRG